MNINVAFMLNKNFHHFFRMLRNSSVKRCLSILYKKIKTEQNKSHNIKVTPSHHNIKEKNQNLILKINVRPMFHKNSHNFFQTFVNSFVKRGYSRLMNKKFQKKKITQHKPSLSQQIKMRKNKK